VRPTVYKPGSGVTDPVLKRKVDPMYPDAARRAGFGGEVWLAAVVLPDGTVGDIVVKRSLDTAFGLDDAAIAAARQWRFEPSRLNGRARVRARVRLPPRGPQRPAGSGRRHPRNSVPVGQRPGAASRIPAKHGKIAGI
jgi:TonB family protein